MNMAERESRHQALHDSQWAIDAQERAKPWHQQLWPWMLIAPPLVSVIGGIALVWVAIATDDGLVTPHYYREGISINQRLTREQAANCAVKDRACMNALVEEKR